MKIKFLHKLLLLTLLPLAVLQIGTMLFATRTAEREVSAGARKVLEVGAEVAKEVLRFRAESLSRNIELLAADFALREVLATSDPASIRSALENHAARAKADFGAYVETDGAVFQTASAPSQEIQDALRDVVEANEENSSVLIERFDDRTLQLFLTPVRAPTVIGHLVFGFELNEALALQIQGLTGVEVTILSLTGGKVRLVAAGERADDVIQNLSLEELEYERYRPGVVHTVGPKSHQILLTHTPIVTGDPNTAVFLKRSVREAMAPFRETRSEVLVSGLVALFLVAALSVWFSSSVSLPLRSLTVASERMASGDYDTAIASSTKDEIATLAASFNRMQLAISEREASIRHQSNHNPVTELPNQSKALTELEHLLQSDRDGVVISIILSRMGKITSTIGQALTEDLICETAVYLTRHTPTGGLVAHIGTHEFVILVPGIDLEEGVRIADDISQGLNSGIRIGSSSIILQSHIGVCEFPGHGEDAQSLLRSALVARSDAQASGHLVHTYQAGREAMFERQLQLVGDIPRAIKAGEIQPFYQPKIDLASGQIHGAEALVRWIHKDFGFLSPAEFIPAAEESGAVTRLTKHMIRQVACDLSGWESQHPDLRVAVNLSTRDLMDDRLISFTKDALAKHDIDGDRFIFEVTESAVMEDVEQASRLLSQLRELSIQIAIDDFGTGHSSLAQLKNLPLDQLKIDRSFVSNLATSAQDDFIVSTTINLAHSLKLNVVAEGIEDDVALRRLAELRCDYAQGFFLGKPMGLEQFLRWMSEYEPSPRSLAQQSPPFTAIYDRSTNDQFGSSRG